jgi:membrane protease YdiL (CAAX protease family)
LSPFVEEVVFRGLVLQRAGEYMGFWKANALSAGLFVGVHVPGWIFSRGPLPGIVSSAAFVLVLALVLGYLPKRTGARGPARCATR